MGVRGRKSQQGKAHFATQQSGRRTLADEIGDALSACMSAKSISPLENAIHLTHGTLREAWRRMLPGAIKEQLDRAYRWATTADNLISACVQTKKDFFGCGFEVTCDGADGELPDRLKMVVDNGHTDPAQEEFVSASQIVDELITHHEATDNAILLWNTKGAQLRSVCTVKPALADYTLMPGFESLKLDIPEEVYRFIDEKLKQEAGGKRRDKKPQGLGVSTELDKMPPGYVDAVRNRQTAVELKHGDGWYWCIRTRGDRFDGLCAPSIIAVVLDKILRDLYKGQDFSVAYFNRFVVEHWKLGAEVPSSAVASADQGALDALQPRPEDFAAIESQYATLGDSMRIYTSQRANREVQFPDPKIFANTKYDYVDGEIEAWAAVPRVLINGRGESGTKGWMGIRRFQIRGLRTRETVGGMYLRFLNHPSMQPVLKLEKGQKLGLRWNEECLEDPVTWLKKQQHLQQVGIRDAQSHCDAFNLNYNDIKARKKRDAKDGELWKPFYDASHGLPDEAGKPKQNAQAAPDKTPRKGGGA